MAGWDSSQRYFLVAANQANTIAVDRFAGRRSGSARRGRPGTASRARRQLDRPRIWPGVEHTSPGRSLGRFGGTDPEGHPEVAWQVVRDHPAARRRQPVHQDPSRQPVDLGGHGAQFGSGLGQRTICVIAKENPAEVYKCWEVADYGRAVHFEYNKEGTEVWVSVWGTADVPGETGEIVIYDDATLEEIARIPDLITPTGKFNVYNTVNDIY